MSQGGGGVPITGPRGMGVGLMIGSREGGGGGLTSGLTGEGGVI